MAKSKGVTLTLFNPKNVWCRAVLIVLNKIGIDGSEWEWLTKKTVFEDIEVQSLMATLQQDEFSKYVKLTTIMYEEKGESK